MKYTQKVLYVAACCAFVAVAFAVVGQRTVQAVVATLVRNMDEPGRNPYQSSASGSGGSTFCNGGGCTIDDDLIFDAVPTGKRLVVTTVSGSFDLAVSDQLLSLRLQIATANNPTQIDLHPVAISSDGTTAHYSFSQDLHGYQDDSNGSPSFSFPFMTLQVHSASSSPTNNLHAALIGYTVSLP